jgi:hypothetical protein
MKRIPLILVMLVFTNLSLSYALPFQEPVAGKYQCFASQDDAFDTNARDAGATLEFITAQSYRFTTTSATEEGTVSSYTFESNEAVFDALWQGASVLQLQPSSGSAAYEGAFFVDKLGASYVVIQNNNGLYLRCQSDGADIAATLKSVNGESLAEETPETLPTPTTATTSSETLQPLQALQSGVYNCYHTYETTFWASTDDPSYYEDDDPDYFAALFFEDGSMLNLEAKDTLNSSYEKGQYTFDATQSKISVEGGNLGGLTLFYGTNANGVPTLSYIRTEHDEGDTDEEHVWTYSCERSEDIPAGVNAASFENGTPTVKLGNVSIATSNYDANNPDPNTIPMTDTYYCYPNWSYVDDLETSLPNYFREYQLDILPNNRYNFNGQEGEFRTGVDEYYFQWISGSLNPTGDVIKGEDDVLVPHSSNVSYDVWGSEITGVDIPQDDTTITVDCFQQGAREQKALLDFALKQPTSGSYGCLTSGDNPQQTTLEILPGNRYSYNGEEGSYRVNVREYATDVLWSSGPLGGDTSYSADDDTGVRTLLFSSTEFFSGGGIPTGSSTETTMVCESVAPANLIPQYSAIPAPAPPTGAGGLDAFYARAEFDQGDLLNGEPPVTTWYYYHFLPNGYVYEDGYATSEECGKTYPNGQPVCGIYTAQGNSITFGDGRKLALLPADSGNGDVIIDGQLFENKKLEGSLTVNGVYEFVVANSSPMYMQIAGMGTNSVTTSTYTLSSDDTYTYASSGWSQTSAPDLFGGSPMGTIGALASNSSSDGDSGTYSIDGNIITFNSAQGYSKQCGFFFPQNGDTTSVNICGTDYDTPSEE